MSLNSRLQGGIKNPRESSRDARVAKTKTSHYTQGTDGKRYNLEDEADQERWVSYSAYLFVFSKGFSR